MQVKIELEGTLAYRLTRDAEMAGIDLPAYLGKIIRAQDRHRPVEDRVQDMVTLGWRDSEIADELHYSKDRVGVIRRSLGLKPNPTYAHVRKPVDKRRNAVDK